MLDFFVSYNRADKAWAEWIAWNLEETKHTTVLQAWDFRPGSNFVLEMQRAASDAEQTIAVLSPDYLEAEFTLPEWAAAFVQDPTGKKGTLLPVRVRKCDLPALLKAIIYIDLVGLGEPAARDALLAGVGRGRAKPSAAPVFPAVAPRSVTEQPRFPGSLPAIWHVPHNRNPNFTGRAKLLADLREALTSRQPGVLTQVLSGMGGVGKTQLAVEYAYRHAGDYSLVWWVRAEEPAQLAGDYARLAVELDLPQKAAPEQKVAIQAARRRLADLTSWLLIFDNALDPAEVREYVPQGGSGHVLVTSRNPNWLSLAAPVAVKVLDRDESVRFLLKRTRQQDQAAAGAVADALGNLPLALEHAGAYVEATGSSLSGYLDLFRAHQTALFTSAPTPLDYHATVTATWQISLGQVRKASAAAADLMNLCAFIAPDDIPKELLSQGAQHLPEPLAAAIADIGDFDKAIAALRRYSLIEVDRDALSVHRLVQAVVRNRLSEDDRKAWIAAAVRLVNGAFPFESDDVRTWPQSSRLLPHALAAAGFAEPLKVAPEAAGRVLNQAGMYLRGRAEFAEARAAFERALKIREATYGPSHPTVATGVNNLGGVLEEQGDLAGARAHCERALEIFRRFLGDDHPRTVTARDNLKSIGGA